MNNENILYLISLLEKQMENKKKEAMKGVNKNKDLQSLERIENNLRNDVNEILNIDNDKIWDLIKLEVDDLDYDKVMKSFSFIKMLLEGNKKNNLGFELDDSQKTLIELLLKAMESKKIKLEEEHNKKLEEAANSKDKIGIYKDTIEALKNGTKLDNLDLIEEMFKMNSVSLKKQNEIILDLIRHNMNLENNSVSGIDSVFAKYGYDYNKLSADMKLLVLENDVSENVKAIRNFLPTLNEENKVFNYILLYSNPEIIKEISEIAYKELIDFNIICKMFNIFIKKDKEIVSLDSKKEKVSRVGAYEYFKENVEFLHSIDISPSKASQINPLILITPTYILRDNEYIQTNNYKINPSDIVSKLSLLTSYDSVRIIDSYIEAGLYNYILKNPFLITATPGRMRFYNLKYARQNKIPIFTKDESGNIAMIKGIHSLKPFMGITEENKEEKIGTYKLVNKEYDEIVERYYSDNSMLNTNYKIFDYLKSYEDFNNMMYIFDENKEGNPIYVSKNKVFRYFSILINAGITDIENALMYAFTKDLIITEKEYLEIKSIIKRYL